MQNLKLIIICGIAWLGLSNFSFAIDSVGVSVGTYGVGVKTKIFPQIVAELRYCLDPDFHTVSGRGCYNLLNNNIFVPFVGIEYGKADFDIEGIKGSLTLMNAFIGSEFAVNKQLSVLLDYGYGNLTFESSGFSVSGPEWIFNIGLNYYFSFNTVKETSVFSSPQLTPTVQTSIIESKPEVEVSSPIISTPPSQTVDTSSSQPQAIIPASTPAVPVKEIIPESKPVIKPLTDEEKEMAKFFYDSGKRLYLAKDYSGAIEQFKQVLKYYPSHPESLKYIDLCEKELKH